MKRPVSHYAKKYGVPIKLANALIGQESGGDDNAVSPVNAVGRMQIHLPSHPNVSAAQARDPDFAMDYGFKLLSGHKRRFGSWRLALAAYNAGAGAVSKYKGVPPYKETQNYVTNILRTTGALGSVTPAKSDIPQARTSVIGEEPAEPLPTFDFKGASQRSLQQIAQGTYKPTAALADLYASRQTPTSAPEVPTKEPITQGSGPNLGLEYDEPKVASGSWEKWVIDPAPRQGPSKHHQPAILQFVGRIGRRAGKKLAPWGNESHSLTTVNGNRSAHADGFGADVPARDAELKRLGYMALLEAGMSKKEALAASRRGGLYNVGGYQIIFATDIGGNHHDHLHVGIRR